MYVCSFFRFTRFCIQIRFKYAHMAQSVNVSKFANCTHWSIQYKISEVILHESYIISQTANAVRMKGTFLFSLHTKVIHFVERNIE